MVNDSVISALIGLAGACSSGAATPDTFPLLLRALSLTPDSPPEEVESMHRAVSKEKFRIAPGCALCASPCGNTSDYDMDRLYASDPRTLERKLEALSLLQFLAAALQEQPPADRQEQEPWLQLLLKTLCWVSYDLDDATLLELLQELRQGASRLQRRENTSSSGT